LQQLEDSVAIVSYYSSWLCIPFAFKQEFVAFGSLLQVWVDGFAEVIASSGAATLFPSVDTAGWCFAWHYDLCVF